MHRDVYYKFNLETAPLHIKTHTNLGSDNSLLRLLFYYEPDEVAGGISIDLSSARNPQYWLTHCSTTRTDFPTELPLREDMIWRVTLSRRTSVGLILHCNGMQVLNVTLSHLTCSSEWSAHWNRRVSLIRFHQSDTISVLFRQTPAIKGKIILRKYQQIPFQSSKSSFDNC